MAAEDARKNLQDALACLEDSRHTLDHGAVGDLINTAEELCHKAGLCISVALHYKQYPNTRLARYYIDVALWYLE